MFEFSFPEEDRYFFFSVVYLNLSLNSPVKIYSLIHANKKKLYHINQAKFTIECFLHIFTNFRKTVKFLI